MTPVLAEIDEDPATTVARRLCESAIGSFLSFGELAVLAGVEPSGPNYHLARAKSLALTQCGAKFALNPGKHGLIRIS